MPRVAASDRAAASARGVLPATAQPAPAEAATADDGDRAPPSTAAPGQGLLWGKPGGPLHISVQPPERGAGRVDVPESVALRPAGPPVTIAACRRRRRSAGRRSR